MTSLGPKPAPAGNVHLVADSLFGSAVPTKSLMDQFSSDTDAVLVFWISIYSSMSI